MIKTKYKRFCYKSMSVSMSGYVPRSESVSGSRSRTRSASWSGYGTWSGYTTWSVSGGKSVAWSGPIFGVIKK